MSIIDEVEALRRIPYFATMDSAKLKLLAFASHRLQLPVGGVLCREGEPGDAAYILLDGEAEVMVRTAEGHDVVVAKVPKNAFIGEIAVLRDVPQFAFEVMRELAERLEDTTGRLREAQGRLDAAGLGN